MFEPPLTADEARVLGCLIEKESTTPDAYPLTVNSLRNACNQSTSRDPVMTLTDLDVERALGSLRERGLTRTVHSTSNRATKFRHAAPEALGLEVDETTVLAVLLLRGAQTAGELKTRSTRLHEFASVDEVATVLHGLAERALAVQLARQPGQKDARWVDAISAGREETVEASVGPAPADATPPADPYSWATAEFYDLLATGHWEQLGALLVEVLADVDPADGPILDVGAGTGIGLAHLRTAVPGAAIHAVEPSRAMRTALHTRLHLDPELRRVTTVDPRPWSTAEPPSRACAVVVSAALGHLDVEERAALWRYVAERLPIGAPAVIEMLPPERPVEVPMTRYRELSVGDYVYEGWQRGVPAGEHTMTWTMEYRVLHGDARIDVSTASANWRCIGVDDVRAEIAPFGLTLTEHDGCVVVRRPT